MLGVFNLWMWTLLGPVPLSVQERSLGQGWEERGEKGMVKYKCSIFICLEIPHRLCFPLELYVMVAIHMMGGDTCVAADIAPSVTTHKTRSFSLSHGVPNETTMGYVQESVWQISGCLCSGGLNNNVLQVLMERQGHHGQTGSERHIKGE